MAAPSVVFRLDPDHDRVAELFAAIPAAGIDEEWREFIGARRREELDAIIESEKLQPKKTEAFMQAAFLNGAIQTSGTAITGILPPTPRFSPDGGHGEKKQRVIARLNSFFERFFTL